MLHDKLGFIAGHVNEYAAMILLDLNPDDLKDRKKFRKLLDQDKEITLWKNTEQIDTQSVFLYRKRQNERAQKIVDRVLKELRELKEVDKQVLKEVQELKEELKKDRGDDKG